MKVLRFIFIFSIITFVTLLIDNVSKAGADGRDKTYGFKDTTIKIVWREDVYDSKLKSKVNVIVINESYFSSVSDPEKAVLGYLASTIGNECYAESNQNVKCKILTALSLGSQCSESNKQFLSAWFKNEPKILKQIENCKPTIPGSTVEKTFDVVKVSTSGDVMKVELKGLKLNIKENSATSWSERLTFKLNSDNLALVERTKTD